MYNNVKKEKVVLNTLFGSPVKKRDTFFTFIDLFAGIGGIRMGFENAGGECVFTSEWDESAQKTYQANFKEKW